MSRPLEYLISTSLLEGIRSAINNRLKREDNPIIASQMPEEIMKIEGTVTTDGTITPEKVLENEIGYSNSEKIIGNIPIREPFNIKTFANDEERIIAAGYYPNESFITTETLANQTSGDGAPATSDTVITGKICWVNGERIVGNLTQQLVKSENLIIDENGKKEIKIPVSFNPTFLFLSLSNDSDTSKEVGAVDGGFYSYYTTLYIDVLNHSGFVYYYYGNNIIIEKIEVNPMGITENLSLETEYINNEFNITLYTDLSKSQIGFTEGNWKWVAWTEEGEKEVIE